jgi:hypothetical protein
MQVSAYAFHQFDLTSGGQCYSTGLISSSIQRLLTSLAIFDIGETHRVPLAPLPKARHPEYLRAEVCPAAGSLILLVQTFALSGER